MRRLRHVHTDVQVLVLDDKADRLIAEGAYRAVPDAEQPTPEQSALMEQAQARRDKPGPSSIAEALHGACGPMWDEAIP